MSPSMRTRLCLIALLLVPWHISALTTHRIKSISLDRGPLCKDGKLLPELYIIGGKNTGTTSLYYDLLHHADISPAPDPKTKEWEFFFKHERQFDRAFNGVWQPLLAKEEWFSSLPECSAQHKMLGDFSVTNLFATPIGPDMVHSNRYGYGADARAWNAPAHINDIYGDLRGNITFGVLLREPLARLQSEWYHTKPLHNCHGCMAKETFGEALHFNNELTQKEPPEISDWMWKNFYGRQLEAYLSYFDPSQFVFSPMMEYFGEGTELMAGALSEHIGRNLGAHEWHTTSHANSHVHPPLSEDASVEDAVAYRNFMKPENDRLVRLLAQASLQGATLLGYEGAAGSESEVRQWLESNW